MCMFARVYEKKQGNPWGVFPPAEVYREGMLTLAYTDRVKKSAKTYKAWQKPKFPSSKKRHTPLCYFAQLFTWLFSPTFVLPFSSF